MKVLIEAMNMPQIWRHGGASAKLRIYALSEFVTADGQWVGAGHPGQLESYYLEQVCAVAGFVLTIPSIEVDSTVDALINPNVRYTAEFITHNNRRVPFIANFPVNTLEPGDPSMTWGEILAIRNGPTRPTFDIPLFRQIASMISLAVGLLNKASATNTGVIALSVDPVDPIFPIAVGRNDPDYLALLANLGLPTVAAGQTTLVNGTKTVLEPLVTSTAAVASFSMDRNVTGTLRVVSIDDGVSFVIESSEMGDNGLVGWTITNT